MLKASGGSWKTGRSFYIYPYLVQEASHVAHVNMVVVAEQPGIYQAGALGASQQ